MGKIKNWKLPSVSHLAPVLGQTRPLQKSIEGLCTSTLLGVLHTRPWLLDAQLVYLLEWTQSSAERRNEESLDPLHNFTAQGKLWLQ